MLIWFEQRWCICSATRRYRMVAITRWSCCRRRRTSPCAWTRAKPGRWSTKVNTNTFAWTRLSSSEACHPTRLKEQLVSGSCATQPASADASKVSEESRRISKELERHSITMLYFCSFPCHRVMDQREVDRLRASSFQAEQDRSRLC